jgi:hypothetical protein
MGVSLEFEKYIKSELIFASDVAKKRGRRRDVKFLSEILDHLFWARCSPDRTVDDLLASLMRSYPGLKRDTLEDNLIFLSKTPAETSFIAITTERDGIKLYSLSPTIAPTNSISCETKHKPKKIYTINEYYLRDYFEKSVGMTTTLRTAIRCNKPPMECPDPSCEICAANGIKTCWEVATLLD